MAIISLLRSIFQRFGLLEVELAAAGKLLVVNDKDGNETGGPDATSSRALRSEGKFSRIGRNARVAELADALDLGFGANPRQIKPILLLYRTLYRIPFKTTPLWPK